MSNCEARRRLRQQIETARCFGVEFVPVALDRMDRPASHRDEAVATGATGMPAAGHGGSDSAGASADSSHPEPVRSHQSSAPPSNRPATRTAAPSTGGRAEGEAAAALAALREAHDAGCPHCVEQLSSVTHTVFGEGDPEADLMFIGEAPGEEEDRTGRPFVGRAGKKLEEIICAMGLTREAVYIANVLKTRPPNNRTPLQHEVDACAPYLVEQMRIIRPKVVVTLGGPATKLMLGTTVGITQLRGQWAEYIDPDQSYSVPVMPTFHPAYLLRNYTPDTRKKVWSDMQAVMSRLG